MKSRVIKAFVFPLMIAVSMLSSCGMKTAYYQKQVPVPSAAWAAKFMPEFKLEIKDTTANHYCFLLFRHDEAYPNSNLWLRLKIKGPGEKTFKDGPKLEVPLADASGVWQGKGMGGIWEHKIFMDPKAMPQFKQPGIYEIRIEQLMRMDPLPSVLNVGLMVEEIKK
ncbi:gliding motility lipoprotein GldH [Taibaiella lutea]|nr:gliding motility lipoprotein GldH [Taibaiella lutea]